MFDTLSIRLKIVLLSGLCLLGVIALINLMALLSLNIGVFNLLPIPMLDGGHLAYYAALALRPGCDNIVSDVCVPMSALAVMSLPSPSVWISTLPAPKALMAVSLLLLPSFSVISTVHGFSSFA